MSRRTPSRPQSRGKAAGSRTRRMPSALIPALVLTALGGAATGLLLSLSRQAEAPASRPPVPAAATAASGTEARRPAPKTQAPRKAAPAVTRTSASSPSRAPAGPAPSAARTQASRKTAEAAPGGRVALTFDAGASAAPAQDILKTLRERSVRCTFFLTGRFARDNPDIVRSIVADGHEPGNHTFSHPDLRRLEDDGIREELRRAEETISAICGRSTRPWFRPPFGARDGRVLKVAREEGYECVYWTLDSWDSFRKGITAREIRERVLGRVKAGDVVLFHIGSRATADALPDILDGLAEKGLECVPVSQLGSPVPH